MVRDQFPTIDSIADLSLVSSETTFIMHVLYARISRNIAKKEVSDGFGAWCSKVPSGASAPRPPSPQSPAPRLAYF
jgi:hypothetical protein